MNDDLIMLAHHKPWEWKLDGSRATRLAPSPLRRWLLVTGGSAWLTRSGAGPEGADIWLRPGERLPLPPGSEWVVEGWPQATVTLLEAPQPQPRRRGIGDWLLRAFAPVLRPA